MRCEMAADTRGRASQINGRGVSLENQTGFTLIELLVVIAVIGLLMALLVPALQRARRAAASVVCQSRLRQWGIVTSAYMDDNQGQLPKTTGYGVYTDCIWFLRGNFVMSSKTKYDPNNLREQQAFHGFDTRLLTLCPMASRIRETSKGDFCYTTPSPTSPYGFYVEYTGGSAFGAWQVTEPTPVLLGSYGCNSSLFTRFFAQDPGRINPPPIDYLSFKGRANIPFILDCTSPFAPSRELVKTPPAKRDMASPFLPVECHGGAVNCIFLDWSVRKVDTAGQ
jgi:prepilin-type N-terminal cleavage/methylation domain-containing protein/prepilin-type processing-associated H-X9-DG protein